MTEQARHLVAKRPNVFRRWAQHNRASAQAWENYAHPGSRR